MDGDLTILEILNISSPLSVLEVVTYLLIIAGIAFAAYMHGGGPSRKGPK